ncbi:Shedu anti-phage system protein SduA domain-containing protein [uncultured Zobellia sp.]|uniref:Shedu anti-phage system protein SduA domain-containing protein n=1 Tax=uncultured Zobellia sp. TaxID=255433 RepID=UPI0025991968|nr:Shedu anti-phage system protein SduA domain-containing protein [uncultured Zobellia sp.]
MGLGTGTSFDNQFDLIERDLAEIEIRETNAKDKCIIWDLADSEKAYNSFLISQNTQSKTICDIAFHKSSQTGKYLPRVSFKRIAKNGDIQSTRSKDKVTIKFEDSADAVRFWKLIGFLFNYKDLVDIGEFEKSFQVVSKEAYVLEFTDKNELEKIQDLKELVGISDLNYNQLKTLTFENRKRNLKAFYYLLKNIRESHSRYREKYKIQPGEEHIWHHFLQSNDWILGLNVDLRFITDFLDEQKVGIENSSGSESPKVDILGISEFTTLIELKHTSADIFKASKSKGRANTWDFTTDFIEGISQCLGQKNELEKSFESKVFLDSDKKRLPKDGIETIDPKALLLIGNKKREFPINELDNTNFLKNKTLERFRRNNRNIDVLTFDELFERAYHIVFSRKLSKEWYWQEEDEIFREENDA